MEHNAKKRFNIIDIIAVVLILAVLAYTYIYCCWAAGTAAPPGRPAWRR